MRRGVLLHPLPILYFRRISDDGAKPDFFAAVEPFMGFGVTVGESKLTIYGGKPIASFTAEYSGWIFPSRVRIVSGGSVQV